MSYSIEDFRRGLEIVLKLSNDIPRSRFLKAVSISADSFDTRWACGVVDAMTSKERAAPSIVMQTARLQRIARGAGVKPEQVKSLIQSFYAAEGMLDELSTLSMRERMEYVRRKQKS
ncbi:MAG: hypothetical protein WD738_11835 [Pirellulales bacterium]